MNVRGIVEKTEELQTELLKRKTDIAVVTETKKKNKGSEDIGNYVMIYCGIPANQWASSGVAIVIRKTGNTRYKITLGFRTELSKLG